MAAVRDCGPLVRVDVGPKRFHVVSDPQLVHRLLVADGDAVVRGRIFDKGRSLIGNGLLTSEGDLHLRQRRLMQPAFHQRRIARYAEVMSAAAAERSRTWRPGRELAMEDELWTLVLRIVTRTLFTSEIGARAVHELQDSIAVILNGLVRRMVSPLELLERLPTRRNRALERARRRVRRVLRETIAAYRAAGRDHGDLLSMLLLARDPETGLAMHDEQICDEVLSITIGGTETTVLTLTWLFLELARHPEVERRLHEELDAALGGRAACHGDLERLPYTGRLVTEVLRLHHPIWIDMRRSVAPLELGRHRLPAGVDFLFSPHAMYRDPRLYERPLALDPDRWQRAGTGTTAFAPFGAGRHKCIGSTFATTEIALVTATIAGRWRFAPVPGQVVRERASTAVRPSASRMLAVPRAA